MTTREFYHFPPGLVHNFQPDLLVNRVGPATEPAGFQLAPPVHLFQFGPRLFDELPRHLLTDAHRALDDCPDAGDEAFDMTSFGQ